MSSDPFPSSLITVVLVRTQRAGNIGSAARAMKNMGVRRLKLVAPVEKINHECQKMAGRAFDLVQEAQHFATLEEAIADENILVATTSTRKRQAGRKIQAPREIAPVLAGAAQRQRVALLFGPERSGLTASQIALCQYLVSIPANPDHPVLNLAQAVLIVTYELYLAAPAPPPARKAKPANQQARTQMFEQMQEVLIEIGFLSAGSPAHIMRTLRRLLGNAEMTERDVSIIRGMMSHIGWYGKEGYQLGPERIRKP